MVVGKEMRGFAALRQIAKRPGLSCGGVVLELLVIILLLAGAFAILKAPAMEDPKDAMLCLFGSVSGCGLLCFLYFLRE